MGLVDASTQLDPTTLVLGLSEGDGAGVPVGLPVAGQVLIEPGPGIPGILIGNNPTNNSITVSVSPSIKCSIWDTDFDTYVSVCSANTIFAKAGGSEALRISATRTIIYAGNVIVLDSTASWTQLRANNQIVLNALDTITGLYRPDSATTRPVVYAEPTKTTISAEDAAGTGEIVVYGSSPYHGIVDMPKQSGCNVYRSTNQLINSSTLTRIVFDNEAAPGYDTKAEYSAGRFTPRKPGFYTVTVQALLIGWLSAGISYIELEIYDGTVFWAQNRDYAYAGITLGTVQTSCKLKLTAGQYIEAFVNQVDSVGAARNLFPGRKHTFMHIQKTG